MPFAANLSAQELYTFGKPYWLIPFAIFLGLFMPMPFYFMYNLLPKGSILAKSMAYLHVPIITLYIGFLPFSVNGQYVRHPCFWEGKWIWKYRWWSCLVIGLASQWWARTRRPAWFKKVDTFLVFIPNSESLYARSQVQLSHIRSSVNTFLIYSIIL